MRGIASGRAPAGRSADAGDASIRWEASFEKRRCLRLRTTSTGTGLPQVRPTLASAGHRL
jgi:hypothetical protein